MTPGRQLISAFIVFHILAVGIAALPPASQWSSPTPIEQGPQPLEPSSPGRSHGPLDALASVVGGVATSTEPAIGLLRPIANTYATITGLDQRWAMFSSTPRYDQYMRTRYYIQAANGRLRIVTELVRPTHRENEVRLLRSFHDSYVDKALDVAVSEFYRRRRIELVRPDTRSEELPDDLAPIGRYFARRYRIRALPATGERMIRTEVWVGTVPNPKPGDPPDPGFQARIATLEGYYDGPVEELFSVGSLPPYHAIEHEADIEWALEYYEAT